MQRFKDILCVATPGPIVRVALERTVALADNNQARLTVVEIIDELPRNTKLIAHVQSLEELQVKIVAGHRKRLEKAIHARRFQSSPRRLRPISWSWARWIVQVFRGFSRAIRQKPFLTNLTARCLRLNHRGLRRQLPWKTGISYYNGYPIRLTRQQCRAGSVDAKNTLGVFSPERQKCL